MGFLDKLIGKKEVAPAEGRKLSINEALELAKTKMNERDFSEGTAICSNIKHLVNETKSNLKELDKATIDQAYHKKLKAAATESRKQLVLKVRKDLSSIQLSDEFSYDNLIRTQKTLSETLSSISAGNRKHGYYTSLVFRNETGKLNKNLNELSRYLNNLKQYLDKIEQQNKPYKEILDMHEKRNNIEKEILDIKSKIELNKKELSKFEESKKEVVAKGGGFTEYAEKKTALEGMGKELEDARLKVYNLIAPLSRIFRKYKKVGLFEKQTDVILSSYIENPVTTAMLDNGIQIKIILEGIEKMVKNNDLELDKKESDKTLRSVEEIRNNLDKYVKQYAELDAKFREEKNKTQDLEIKKHGVETEAKDIDFKANNLSSEVSVLEKKLSEKEKELSDLNEKLEKNSATLK